MSKIICDICGTEYDDSVGSCPVCGWDQNGDLPADIGDFDSDFLDDLQTDIPVPGAAPVKPVAPKIPSTAPKAKTAFDYDAANARTRPAPKKPAPAVEDEDDDEFDRTVSAFSARPVKVPQPAKKEEKTVVEKKAKEPEKKGLFAKLFGGKKK